MPIKPERAFTCRTLAISLVLLAAPLASTFAHPGAAIAVDAQERVLFVDTGGGLWRIDSHGKLELLSRLRYHWMAFDVKGAFAQSRPQMEWDRGSFERITPQGAAPAVILSSDYPIAMGRDGGLYYVPYSASGPRQLIRRMPDGRRSVFATLPKAIGTEPVGWVNGIAAAADGTLYVTDDDTVRRIGTDGVVTTVRDSVTVTDCADPLQGAPKLPYLRGLAVAQDGTIYVAASGCRAVIAIPAQGPVRTVLKAERPWSPTAVALSGGNIYVLEYLHTAGEDRTAWIPRVRKIASDGSTVTLATIKRN